MSRWAVAVLVLGAVSCTPAPAGAGGERSGGAVVGAPGGKMSEVSVSRLGTIVPGTSGGEERHEFVDPHPVVLWAGGQPAAVLAFRRVEDVAAGTREDELAVVPGTAGAAAGFPLRWATARAVTDSEAERLDTLHPAFVVAADVNGDGTDELVVARRLGGLDVVALGGVVARHPGASRRTAAASYTPVTAQVARLEGRAVVHVLYERREHGHPDASELERIGAGDPYQLLRVDGRGVTRVVLRGLDPGTTEVLAVGAVNRPGSREVDELVVVARRGTGREVLVSRHAPDGAALDAPRKVYTDLDPSTWDAWFLRESPVVVLMRPGEARAHFVEAAKPVNWIRSVDLSKLKPDLAAVEPLGVADAASEPKAVLRIDEKAYVVDAQGRYWVPGAGGLVAQPAPAPLYASRAPSELHRDPLFVPSPARGDDFLVLRSRPKGLKDLSDEEVARAADRFLQPDLVARERRRAEPSLTDDDPVRDGLIAEERRRRRFDGAVETVEDWKRLLPDSYQASARDRAESLRSALHSDLTFPLERPAALTPRRYRNIEELRSWLAALERPAEVVVEHVRRGAVVASAHLDGALGPVGPSELVRAPIEWRSGATGEVLVMTLSRPSADGKPEPGLYLVRFDGKRR